MKKLIRFMIVLAAGVCFGIFIATPATRDIENAKVASKDLAMSALSYGYTCGIKGRPIEVCRAEGEMAMHVRTQ